MKTLIKLENKNVFLKGNLFFSKVNFDIKSGEIVHLIGENGSGKSTFINEIVSELDNVDYGYLPQVAHQFPKVHFLLSDISNKEFDFYPRSLFFKAWDKASGGERKKALISKTFAEGKDLVVLDEPFNHLDKKSSELIISHIRKFASSGRSIIYTGHEHNISEARIVEVEQWR